MGLIEILKEVMGTVSSYKVKYQKMRNEKERLERLIAEAEKLAKEILDAIRAIE